MKLRGGVYLIKQGGLCFGILLVYKIPLSRLKYRMGEKSSTIIVIRELGRGMLTTCQIVLMLSLKLELSYLILHHLVWCQLSLSRIELQRLVYTGHVSCTKSGLRESGLL